MVPLRFFRVVRVCRGLIELFRKLRERCESQTRGPAEMMERGSVSRSRYALREAFGLSKGILSCVSAASHRLAVRWLRLCGAAFIRGFYRIVPLGVFAPLRPGVPCVVCSSRRC